MILEAEAAVDRRLPLDRVKQITADICAALDYAHAKGIIHRDVKPSNIIIDARDRAILTDFGLALLVEAGTRGEIFGSPLYIAPEQAISSANATMQSDLYSAGVILYEMITGHVPFTADNPLDVAMLHMTEAPRPPSQLNPQVTPQLDAVLLRALAKEPNDRYQTGEELVQALAQALRAAPVAAPIVVAASAAYALPPIPAAVAVPAVNPAAPVPAIAARRKSRKPLAILIALLLLALLIGGGAYAWSQNNSLGLWLLAAVPGTATSTPTSEATSTPGSSIVDQTPTALGTSLLTPFTPIRGTPSRMATAAAAVAALATETPVPTATATRTLTPTVAATQTLTPTIAVSPTATLTLEPPTPTLTLEPARPTVYYVWLPLIMQRYRSPR
jgi:hypothetical protein